jgi:uroporphyrinogen III methyltransferase/synthase
MKTGKVYLVGAGPGDPGLITQKGLDCLAKADVIICDHLVDKQVLQWAPAGIEIVYAGKTPSKHTKEQVDINRLLVDKANEGKIVVRLKGGDPFIFGRGGEEAAVLADNGIPFEIVPGISSATAVPAYAGIPVTHRGLSSSFAVITGHEDPDKEKSSINWEKLATATDTLVFLMGMRNLPEIVGKLIEHGRRPDTPAAVINNGTQPEQRTVTGTLQDIVDKVTEAALSSPAVIVVGDVVRLRDKLGWFDNQPLFGRNILVTRAQHQAATLSRLLYEHGARPVELPLIDIQLILDTAELDSAISNLNQYQWIVFTSVNGVELFFKQLHTLKQDARALHGVKICVIGPATAEAVESKGLVPDCCPAVFTSQGIIDALKQWNIAGQRFLLPRADIADRQLNEDLARLGAEVHEVSVYKTVAPSGAQSRLKEVLSSNAIDVIALTSSSTVQNLLAAVQNEHISLSNVKIACIGPKTADTVTAAGLKVDIIAREHTMPGLVAAMEQYFRKESR